MLRDQCIAMRSIWTPREPYQDQVTGLDQFSAKNAPYPPNLVQKACLRLGNRRSPRFDQMRASPATPIILRDSVLRGKLPGFAMQLHGTQPELAHFARSENAPLVSSGVAASSDAIIAWHARGLELCCHFRMRAITMTAQLEAPQRCIAIDFTLLAATPNYQRRILAAGEMRELGLSSVANCIAKPGNLPRSTEISNGLSAFAGDAAHLVEGAVSAGFS